MKERDDQDQEYIMPDWMIVKTEIWESWFAFTKDLSNFFMYQQMDKTSRSVYLGTVKHFFNVISNISKPRLEKYLNKEEMELILKLDEQILDGKMIEFRDLNRAKEHINKWFMESGMGDIEKQSDNKSRSITQNR